MEMEELEPNAPNAVISISYARSFFLCNEYVTNHFIHFSDGSLAVAARLDCECKYTKKPLDVNVYYDLLEKAKK